MTSPKLSESYKISNLHMIHGGSQIIHQSILQLVVDKARETVQQSRGAYTQFDNLLEPLSHWKHAHYRNLSSMLDIPLSTLKYYFQKGESLKTQNRKKILEFMQVQHWENIEKEALYKIFQDKIENSK
ncbi:MAG: hypothetical protein NW226_17355 [Microscillaceae bacterium]|nr:hypothetical protein [Microscillaceae bacterium]